MEQRLSLITLGVANVAASRAFYERLGWKACSVGGDDVAFFQTGSIAFALWNRDKLAEDAGMTPTSGGSFGGFALAHNVHNKGDVDGVLQEAVRAGGRLLQTAEEKFWGGYSGYFADPDGHPWEVAWNPGFLLKNDGSLVLPA